MKYLYHFLLLMIFTSCKNDREVKYDKNSVYFPEEFQTSKLDSLRVWVSSIKDGDSFVGIDSTNQEIEVRMLYIDTPEKFQPFSIVARQFTADQIFQEYVTLYYYETDQYGRKLALVLTPEGKVLNEELLKNGLAWHFTRYSKDKKYAHWEDSAQQNAIGVFSKNEPIEPWNWRKQRSQNKDLGSHR